MSKTIDEKVVSMQFDNKQFEQNVKTSMSTIDKLKQSLRFKNADDGLKNIESSIRKVDMKGLGGSVEAVSAKFSALQVMGVTALANITNSAVNAGKRLVAAFTIDPVKTGFQEYELKMNSVQTIMASTGEKLETVNECLKELNEYSDKTIYSFSDMTSNIGKFTNAGVKLEDAVLAIKGISNEAAVSGANAQEASRAMYNFSQALSAGYVKLIDWKSIENANMATVEFKNQLIQTAVACGTLTKTADGMYSTGKHVIDATHEFNDSLTDQWMTTEVLTKTLANYATDVRDMSAEEKKAYEEKLRGIGYTEEQIKSIEELGKKAFDSAQDVKTFSMMMDTLKEAAQSGWAETWELIFGDFEQAKQLWTTLSNFFGELIGNMSEARNALLRSALGRGFTSLKEKIDKVIEPAEKAAETITKTVEAVSDLGGIVDDVILGKFGSGKQCFDALTEAGINYYKVQNKVNETLNNGYRYTDEQIAAQDKLLGIQNGTSEATKEETKATSELTEEKKKLIKQMASLSEEEMRAKNYNEDQIAALMELKNTAESLGIPLNEFIDNLDQINGRWLLLNSFKNIGKSIISVFKSIGTAWQEIFKPLSTDEKAEGIFNIIAAFHKFTQSIRSFAEDEATVDKLVRTFKGLFAILDLVTTFVGGGFKFAFKTISYILSFFNLDILDVTASIGDALVWFRDWVKENNLLKKGLDAVLPYLKEFALGIKDWLAGIKEADNIPKYIIEGLVNGLKAGVKSVVEAVIELGKSIIEGICSVLGIHSPSTEFFDIGKNIIQGLINGLGDGLSSVWEFMKSMGSKLIELIKKIDFGAVFAVGMGVGTLLIINKLASALKILSKPIEGIGDILESVSDTISKVGNAFAKNLKAKAMLNRSKAILNMAIAIGILAASIYTLSKIEPGKLWATIGAIAAIAGIIAVLSAVSGKLNKSGDLGKTSLMMIAISASLLIVSKAMKNLSKIKGEDAPKILEMLAAMIIGMGAVLYAFGKFVQSDASSNMDKAGIMLLKVAVALYIMVKVVKMASKLDAETMGKGLAVVALLELFVMGLVAVSKLSGEYASKAGSMMLKIAFALLIMVGVVKLAGQLNEEELGKGLAFVAVLGAFAFALIAVSILAGRNAAKAGSMLLMISSSLLIMVGVIKLAGQLSAEELIKGLTVIAVLEAFMIALIAVSKLAGKNAARAGIMLLAVSASLIILTGVLFLLGNMDTKKTFKALAIVSILEILFGRLIAVTKLANDCIGTIITLTACMVLILSVVSALTLLDQDKLRSASASVSLLIGTFASLVAATGTLKTPKLASKTLLSLVGVMAAIAAILSIMTLLNVEPSIKTAASIGLLLNAMASSMLILSEATYISNKSIKQLAIIGLIVLELGAILKVIELFNIDPSMKTIAALSTLLISMSAALILVSIAGTLGPAATSGIVALMEFVGAVGLLLSGLGVLDDLTNGKLADIVERGIPILQSFGEGIGAFVGGLVGGAISGLIDGLSGIGDGLNEFITSIQPFIDAVSNIDPTAMEGGKALADMIIVLTASNVLDGLSNLLGGRNMSELGLQLVSFGESLVKFSDTVKGKIDQSAVESAANAGMIMAEMQKSIVPSGGVVQWFTGEKDMSAFGEQLVSFGGAIVEFSKTVSAEGAINETAIQAAANAGSIMAEFQSKLISTSGVVQWFTGEKDMAKFGSQLVSFGSAIVEFSKTVSTEGAINETAITAAKDAGMIMLELQNALDPIGGVVGFFCGDNNLKKFGKQIKSFGESVVSFSQEVEEGGITSSSAEAAKNAGMIMIELQKAIPDKQAFDGKVTLKKFGKQVKAFGKSLADYADEVEDIDIESLTASSQAGKCIADTAKMLQYLDTDKIEKFNLSEMGESLKKYYDSIADIDSLKLAGTSTSISKLVDTINKMSSINPSGVSSFKSAVNSLSTVNVKGLASNFKSYSAQISSVGSNIVTSLNKGIVSKQGSINSAMSSIVNKALNVVKSKTSAFTSAGKGLMIKFSSAISSQKSKVSSGFTSVLSASVSTIRNRYSKFYNAGSYLVTGFASGITANTFRAEAKAKAMAEAAYQAAKEVLKINSPSKVFRSLATSIPEGFAQGIDRETGVVTSSSRDMAESAIKATKKSLSSLGNLILDDIDSQPTIRPVIDLSDVNSGINAINGMFGFEPSIGAVANIRAISTMMNNRQNGTDSDVVSAINKLEKALGKTGNTTYTINGITYDDGSNISDAVRTLVRAVRIEGRA